MRAFAVSMMAVALVAGCGKGNKVAVRTNPVLPDSLSVKSIHTGSEDGWRFVSLSINGGSNYTHFRAYEAIAPTSASGGFYRFDYQSPNKRPVLLTYGYRFSVNRVVSPLENWTVKLEGPGDRKMKFEGLNPDGNKRFSVEQEIKPGMYATPLGATLAGTYTGFLATASGRSGAITLNIDGAGAVSSPECRIVGKADAYKNASVARLRLTVPDNNGCGLKALRNVEGLLLFEGSDTAFLMADQRERNQSNGLYGEFARTAPPVR